MKGSRWLHDRADEFGRQREAKAGSADQDEDASFFPHAPIAQQELAAQHSQQHGGDRGDEIQRLVTAGVVEEAAGGIILAVVGRCPGCGSGRGNEFNNLTSAKWAKLPFFDQGANGPTYLCPVPSRPARRRQLPRIRPRRLTCRQSRARCCSFRRIRFR